MLVEERMSFNLVGAYDKRHDGPHDKLPEENCDHTYTNTVGNKQKTLPVTIGRKSQKISLRSCLVLTGRKTADCEPMAWTLPRTRRGTGPASLYRDPTIPVQVTLCAHSICIIPQKTLTLTSIFLAEGIPKGHASEEPHIFLENGDFIPYTAAM